MTNSNSKFKWHYLIIASIMLGILASLFVVGASADEVVTFSALNDYPNLTYDEGLYVVLYDDDYTSSSYWSVTFDDGVYLINSPVYQGNTLRAKCSAIRYTSNRGLIVTYTFIDSAGLSSTVTEDWNETYALYGYFSESTINSLRASALLNSTEYSYPLTVGSSYVLYSDSFPVVNNDYFFSINLNFSVYSALNNTYYGSFNRLEYNANTGYATFSNSNDSHLLSLNYDDSFYITIDESSGVPYDELKVAQFGYRFVPFTPTETPVANPFTSIADFVTDFISTIIEGLGSLEFYPGVSLLTLLYCFVGILLVRYLLKLIAGG